jgi:dTDP-4-amino-4,6-dideoxygalactose transaminase
LDARYRSLLADLAGVVPVQPPAVGTTGAHHLFAVVLDESIDRDAVRTQLARQGIQTSLHYPPVHRFSIYAADGAQLPLTDAFARRAVTLPLFAHMTHAQQDNVVEALAQAVVTAPVL